MNPSTFGNDYSTGLCGLCDDVGICVQTICCPCITQTLNTTALHDREFGCDSLVMFNNPYWDRQLLRERKGMKLDRCGDCCVCSFCYPCMLMQDAREIKAGLGEPIRKVPIDPRTERLLPRT